MNEQVTSDQPAQNTDRELWREREGDYYADSIHVTAQGGIGINCGGCVYVKTLRQWHDLAGGREPFFLRKEQPTLDQRALRIGDPCPTCATGRIGQSGVYFRCANCGWLGQTNTTSAAMEAAGAKEAERFTPPYTADNGDSKSVAAAGHSSAPGSPSSKQSAIVRAGNAFAEAFKREPANQSDAAWLNGYVAACNAPETNASQPLDPRMVKACNALREILAYEGHYATDRNPTIRAIKRIAEDGLVGSPEKSSATQCEDCEGSGESSQTWHDGTQYSTKEPPCSTCGGTGKAPVKTNAGPSSATKTGTAPSHEGVAGSQAQGSPHPETDEWRAATLSTDVRNGSL